MENMIKIKGYHTCKVDGGLGYIWKHAPFISKADDDEKENQRPWLTQGYYFWTDSVHFAHEWGERPPRNGKYAIVECLIEVEKSELLDLVGSVEDQLYFDKIATKYYHFLKEQNPNAVQPTVNVILTYYRKKGLLPYHAIKAQDGYSERKVTFIHNRKEFLPLVTRQQLCLFDFAVECIKHKQIIHPEKLEK